MNINRKNYEIYMLDYIEGSLPLDIKKDFVAFLNMNPDLKTQAEDLNEYKLERTNVLFNLKNILKKDPEFDIPGVSSFDQLCVSQIEKDISPSENLHLNEILNKSQSKQKEFQLFQQIKLKPDFSIVFKNKNYLKHRNFAGIYMLTALAASLLLLLAFTIFLSSEKSSGLALSLTNTSNINNFNRAAYQTNNIVKGELLLNDNEIKNQPQIINASQFSDSNGLNLISPIKSSSIEQISHDNIAININDILFHNKQEVQPQPVSVPQIGIYLKNQLKEKILKQPANEKATMASVGKFFSKSLSKIFNKEIKINKKVMEDGSTLYAFKAGSVEIYTNIKPSRKTEPTYNSDRSNRLRSNRE